MRFRPGDDAVAGHHMPDEACAWANAEFLTELSRDGGAAVGGDGRDVHGWAKQS